MNRRSFLKKAGAGMAVAALGSSVLDAFGSVGAEELVILHTNDFHSRMEPFPAGDPKYG
ncbi:MAG: twin-arginine translocation signal domain-containing protein, partial [Bacteroidia bacterium]